MILAPTQKETATMPTTNRTHVVIDRPAGAENVSMVIEARDGRWQLVVDADGIPHLYVRMAIEPGPDTTATSALVLVEDFMPDDCKVRDLMAGVASSEPLTQEQLDAAHAEFLADRERHNIPCPR